MKSTTPRLELGTSDPISYICTCDSKTHTSAPGQTLLFYRYFSKPPLLPSHHQSKLSSNDREGGLERLAERHTGLLEKWDLGGRIRVGVEGFNGSVAGSQERVEGWVEEVTGGWEFEGLGLNPVDFNVDIDTDENEKKDFLQQKRNQFFKPTPGCKCVFGTERSVRVKQEITPMGVEGWTPRSGEWDGLVELEPWEWHDVFVRKGEKGEREKERVLIDVRNYYESRIGYFVDLETGREAVRPGIRRFSQWPLWVRERMGEVVGSALGGEKGDLSSVEEIPKEKEIFTYCTGGIRCEKGVRFMQEALHNNPSNDGLRLGKVYTLKGGIAAYLIWMDEEIAAGRKTNGESLFRGRNYVFDARGSTGLLESKSGDTSIPGVGDMESMKPVSKCQACGVACDRLGKCRSKRCHLVLVICEGCEGEGDVRCCVNCKQLEERREDGGGDGSMVCECEREREKELWGGSVKMSKDRKQGWRKERRMARDKMKKGLDIRIKTF